MSDHQQQQHALQAERIISRLPTFRNAQRIAFYLAEDGELDPLYLIEKAWQFNKQVFLPVLPPTGQALVFAPFSESSVMKCNRFGIAEPQVPATEWITARRLGLIIMPLVGFDSKGNRLGMGGGFYDRSLAFKKHRQHWRAPRLIGLAHEIQKVDQLPSASWDIPLDMIVTEKNVYRGAP